ncbi:methionine aminopeptidase [Colletotrichum scovillei]|uniref:Methionine aminopeptidase 2 n=1 Tax=Colletotrichum scovillei TaxID=1209932 RepID=A0A9P7RCC4_9PEZI|nr:methionine aminopeptidase [Colletotrichum scovillei]KAF4785102.1 methionine aminopeptidase [Colletotrichum scovillei]KAG7054870.1 methionyl aminopeptidase [Colletotrichum scovillei]KAG7074347.1 methionyl aminopeptidase [Colletotrichum scovillei]KAG7081572.1 methionyl aminopeptidase [Colletotrichum scovillei]
MGSKTPEDQTPGGNGGPTSSGISSGGEPRGVHLSRDGDGSLGDGGDDDGDDDEEDEVVAGSGSLKDAADNDDGNDEDGPKKKKRKPRKKKKKKKASTAATATKQSDPPRVPLSDLFSSGSYPAGEAQAYTKARDAATAVGVDSDMNTARTTAAELRYRSRPHLEDPSLLNDYRKAAEVHRQVRQWVQDTVKPGKQTLLEIATGIEDGVRSLLGNQGLEVGDALKAGMGFPTGLCLNHEVAHYTPNPGQKDVVLKYEDVMKVDFGVHVNGWIVDSAFTMSFDPAWDSLLAGVRAATESGIKAAGIDVRICDVSAAIQETMESYEVEVGGKMFPVKPVRNICAHDIARYQIHAGKSIPFIKNNDQTKMEEGEIFAIETFGTTGRGKLYDDVGIYGYKLDYDAPAQVKLPFASANRLYKTIKEQFGSIVFCRRYLDRLGLDRYLAGLKSLESHGILESYAPLADIKGSQSAQFEHTILLRENNKEIISRGSDY